MTRLRALIRNNRGFLALVLLFGLVRTALADYNPVPSGSMHPTILEGDVVLVNRLAYDLKLPLTDIVLAHLGEPARGDIVTFSSPKDGTRLIKRVIGLPGELVQMRDKRLSIDGKPLHYALRELVSDQVRPGRSLAALRVSEGLGADSHQIQWLASISNMPDFGPIRIPAGQYLMLGDNRDDSADSRYIGLVPRALLIGRAERILVSAAITEDWSLRPERFGKSLYR